MTSNEMWSTALTHFFSVATIALKKLWWMGK